jgi:hypothetical protein
MGAFTDSEQARFGSIRKFLSHLLPCHQDDPTMVTVFPCRHDRETPNR